MRGFSCVRWGSIVSALLMLECGSSDSSSGSTAGSSGSAGSAGSAGVSGSAGSSGAAGSAGSGGTSTSLSFTTVFTILLENHDYNEIVGSENAPYINSLIDQYGLATNYFDSGVHPSLPNYLYLISGDTQYPGLADVDPTQAPWFPSDADNLGNQLSLKGIKWRSYQEHMGTPCKLQTDGTYAPKHNPFVYFSDFVNAPNNLCNQLDVDYTELAADLASGAYQYMWITPDLLSDGHNPTDDPVQGLKQSDAWLATEIPKILASNTYQQGGVIFITWDEAEGRNGNDKHQIPMIVISPKLKSAGMKVSTKLTHASYLATIQDLYGLPRLKDAVGASTLFEFFE
ncbi:MAG: alkaline phosphatase family protein [Polyangiaceae bacterium]